MVEKLQDLYTEISSLWLEMAATPNAAASTALLEACTSIRKALHMMGRDVRSFEQVGVRSPEVKS